jgi:hypothetical protein
MKILLAETLIRKLNNMLASLAVCEVPVGITE